MKVVGGIVLFFFFQAALAGGAFAPGTIAELSVEGDLTSFTFERAARKPPLVEGCPSITVKVRYSRVPWYSWLPFARTSHPSEEQTRTALRYIESAYRDKSQVVFGPMGRGLMATEMPCVFRSRGLLLGGDEKGRHVLSFFNPV